MELERYAPILDKNGFNNKEALKKLTWHELMELIPDIERPHTQVILRGAKNVTTPKTKVFIGLEVNFFKTDGSLLN